MPKRKVTTKRGRRVKTVSGNISDISMTKEVKGSVLAEVTYSLGATINMGQYESLRIAVGVKLPCQLAKTGKAMAEAKRMVEKEIEGDIQRYRAQGGVNT